MFYPLIEEWRSTFVEKYESDIQKNLPFTSALGEVYRNANDVEIGTLKYMAETNRLLLGTKEYEKLKLYTEIRNRLSHLKVVSFDEIRLLYL